MFQIKIDIINFIDICVFLKAVMKTNLENGSLVEEMI